MSDIECYHCGSAIAFGDVVELCSAGWRHRSCTAPSEALPSPQPDLERLRHLLAIERIAYRSRNRDFDIADIVEVVRARLGAQN